ncbi:MAG TPA: hypothetical protein VFX41_00070 [Actinomycetales bacterium]|nr:hypothetical protein [Actinomycetales bacterium]
MDTVDHRAIAVQLFNSTWDLLEQPHRTVADDDRMLHMAHASRYHWGEVGQTVNLERGEWQVSRVYAVLRRAEPALHHARRALTLCEEAGIADFDIAYCYEAMARASAVAGDAEGCDLWLARALQAAEHIRDPEDRDLLLRDLETVRLPFGA